MTIYFIGDFNADPHSGRAWLNLSNFMRRNSLKCFDVDSLDANSFTFVGYGNSQSRWLDHIVVKEHEDMEVTNVRILCDINGSDHVPIEFKLRFRDLINFDSYNKPIQEINTRKFVNWENIKPIEFEQMNAYINAELRSTYGNHSAFQCNTVGCRNVEHLKVIDNMYSHLIEIVAEASAQFNKQCIKQNKFKVIPGWKRNIKHLHRVARDNYLTWIGVGKSLNTEEHANMLISRREFKKALTQTKLNEHKEVR